MVIFDVMKSKIDILFKNRDEELKWLSWMEIQFTKIAGEDGEINLEEFKDALGVKRVREKERQKERERERVKKRDRK